MGLPGPGKDTVIEFAANADESYLVKPSGLGFKSRTAQAGCFHHLGRRKRTARNECRRTYYPKDGSSSVVAAAVRSFSPRRMPVDLLAS
jgi:hypothetical protein